MQDKHAFSIKLAKGGTGCNKKFFFNQRFCFTFDPFLMCKTGAWKRFL
jgi:hypothetical protein